MATTPIYTCNVNSLLIAAACFLENKIGSQQRRGIELHARAHELAAIGGTSYVGKLDQLMIDGALWRTLACNQREAISTYRTVADANFNGAGIASDINDLIAQSNCYVKVPTEQQKNLLAYLGCAISTQNKAD